MNQDDQEFQQFVCRSLQELSDKNNEMDARLSQHIEMNKEMYEVVMMGKSMFKMAEMAGKGMRIIAYFVASAGILWASIKGFGK